MRSELAWPLGGGGQPQTAKPPYGKRRRHNAQWRAPSLGKSRMSTPTSQALRLSLPLRRTEVAIVQLHSDHNSYMEKTSPTSLPPKRRYARGSTLQHVDLSSIRMRWLWIHRRPRRGATTTWREAAARSDEASGRATVVSSLSRVSYCPLRCGSVSSKTLVLQQVGRPLARKRRPDATPVPFLGSATPAFHRGLRRCRAGASTTGPRGRAPARPWLLARARAKVMRLLPRVHPLQCIERDVL